MTKTLLPTAALAATLALALSGCSAPSSEAADGIQIVASTDVYGDIARTIAGDDVTVTSIIEGANRDPHSYEATARDQLALSKADLVIENGGGYDPFIDTMLSAIGDDSIVVISASEVSGLMPDHEGEGHEHDHEAEDHEGEGHEHEHEHDHDHEAEDHESEEHADETEEHAHDHEGHEHIEGFNEHVWYSFAAMDALAHEIADHLGELDPARADEFHANYDEFAAGLATLTERAEQLKAEHAGDGVAITEPVPLHLFELIGLDNLTPDEFSEAIEEGTDVAPADLHAVLTLIADGDVKLLAYNEQTAGTETEQLRAAADKAGVTVVSLTETLPADSGYLAWMADNLDAVADALA